MTAGAEDPFRNSASSSKTVENVVGNYPSKSDPLRHAEWPGSVPSKWMDRASNHHNSRQIVYTAARNGDDKSLARMGMGSYFRDPRGLVREQGLKYIPAPQYPEGEWRPLVKKVDEVSGWERPDRPEGTKRQPPMEGQRPTMRREKRHLRQVESHQEIFDIPEGKHIARIQHQNEDGSTVVMRQADKVAKEATLEDKMGRKIDKPRSLLEQRNGIPCQALGDKYYKYPEYSDRFYKGLTASTTAELIPGSGFVRGSYQKTIPRMTTNWEAFGAECFPESCRRKTFAQLEAEAAQKMAEDSVVELTTTWEKKELKFGDPNYEEPSDDDQ